MEIEQSIKLEKSQVIGMLKDRGIDIPKNATLHISKTKDGELLVVKWFVKQTKTSAS
jgi:hypothetical protein